MKPSDLRTAAIVRVVSEVTEASILLEIMSGGFGENADKDDVMMTLRVLLRGQFPVLAGSLD